MSEDFVGKETNKRWLVRWKGNHSNIIKREKKERATFFT